MTPRQLLEAMNPGHSYADWSSEDVMSKLLWQLRMAAIHHTLKAPTVFFGNN